MGYGERAIADMIKFVSLATKYGAVSLIAAFAFPALLSLLSKFKRGHKE